MFSQEETMLLTDQWHDFCNAALGGSAINEELFAVTVRDTFLLLSETDKEQIPNAVAKLLVPMTEFSVFALFSSSKKGVDYFAASEIAKTLPYQFLDGFDWYGSGYPFLNTTCFSVIDLSDLTVLNHLDKNELSF